MQDGEAIKYYALVNDASFSQFFYKRKYFEQKIAQSGIITLKYYKALTSWKENKKITLNKHAIVSIFKYLDITRS